MSIVEKAFLGSLMKAEYILMDRDFRVVTGTGWGTGWYEQIFTSN